MKINKMNGYNKNNNSLMNNNFIRLSTKKIINYYRKQMKKIFKLNK